MNSVNFFQLLLPTFVASSSSSSASSLSASSSSSSASSLSASSSSSSASSLFTASSLPSSSSSSTEIPEITISGKRGLTPEPQESKPLKRKKHNIPGYVGKVIGSQPHGHGCQTYDDGSYYVGEFKFGKRSGEGYLIRNGQKEKCGTWFNDSFLWGDSLTAVEGEIREVGQNALHALDTQNTLSPSAHTDSSFKLEGTFFHTLTSSIRTNFFFELVDTFFYTLKFLDLPSIFALMRCNKNIYSYIIPPPRIPNLLRSVHPMPVHRPFLVYRQTGFVGKLPPHVDKVKCLAVQGHYLASSSSDGALRIWDLSTLKIEANQCQFQEPPPLPNVTQDMILGVGFSSANCLVTVQFTGSVKKWTLENSQFKEVADLEVLSRSFHFFHILPGERAVFVTLNHRILILDFNSSQYLTFKGHMKTVVGVVELPDKNQIVSLSEDYLLVIWDLSSQQIHNHFSLPLNSKPSCLSRLTNEDLLIGLESGGIVILNLKTREVDSVLIGHTGKVNCILKLSNGLIASTSNDGHVIIWIEKTRRLLNNFVVESPGPLTSIAELPNGDLAVVSGQDILICRHLSLFFRQPPSSTPTVRYD